MVLPHMGHFRDSSTTSLPTSELYACATRSFGTSSKVSTGPESRALPVSDYAECSVCGSRPIASAPRDVST